MKLSTYQGLEHANKISKVPGDLVSIRQQGTRDQWCLTFSERSRIVYEASAMLDMHAAGENYSAVHMKETGPSRIKRDKQDAQKIVDQLKRFAFFSTKIQVSSVWPLKIQLLHK